MSTTVITEAHEAFFHLAQLKGAPGWGHLMAAHAEKIKELELAILNPSTPVAETLELRRARAYLLDCSPETLIEERMKALGMEPWKNKTDLSVQKDVDED